MKQKAIGAVYRETELNVRRGKSKFDRIGEKQRYLAEQGWPT